MRPRQRKRPNWELFFVAGLAVVVVGAYLGANREVPAPPGGTSKASQPLPHVESHTAGELLVLIKAALGKNEIAQARWLRDEMVKSYPTALEATDAVALVDAEEKKIAASVKADQERAEAERSDWQYQEQPDEMGGTSKFAVVEALSSVSFGFPYNVDQKAVLVLRRSPRRGKSVYLNLQKAQFLCSYDDCHVTIRFDDGKAQTWSATESADHSTNVLFIDNFDRFVGQLKTSKRVRIEAQFYQESSRVFEFRVQNLKF